MTNRVSSGAWLKALAATAFAALITLGPTERADATTLATFDVNGGFLYLPFGGASTFLSTGTFSGTADPSVNPSVPYPVTISAKITADISGIGPLTVLDQSFGPVVASVDQAISEAMSIATMLTGLASNLVTDVGAYLQLANVASLADPAPSYGNTPGAPLPPGYDFLFKYTGGLAMTPLSVSGAYLLQITSEAPAPTLATVLNRFIAAAGAPFVVPDTLQSGTFSASFKISAAPAPVPVPASLPMLAGGLLVFVLVLGVLRRRRVET